PCFISRISLCVFCLLDPVAPVCGQYVIALCFLYVVVYKEEPWRDRLSSLLVRCCGWQVVNPVISTKDAGSIFESRRGRGCELIPSSCQVYFPACCSPFVVGGLGRLSRQRRAYVHIVFACRGERRVLLVA
ncbi:unnamed protein product, partial [Ectocarpus fasciculatus]